MIKKSVFFVLFFQSAFAISAESIGDWTVSKELKGWQFANTTNLEGSSTGVVCSTSENTCNSYIGLNANCDVGNKYPMMINSSVGAFVIFTTCVQIGNVKFYFIDDFDSAKSAFESGGEIGFAIPLQNGNFRSIRFSTKGATASIKNAMTIPSPTPSKQSDYQF